MSTASGSRLLPTLALLGAAMLWGSSFIAMKVAVGVFPPPLVVFGRMFIGTGLFALLFRRLRYVRYRKGDWRWLLLMAAFEPGLYFLFEAYALRLTTASQAGMVAALLPLMMGVGAVVFLGERPKARTWLGFILAVVGVVWLSMAGSSSENAPHPLLGNMLEFLAMSSAVGYMLLLKRLSAHYSPWFLTAVQTVCGCLFYLPFVPFFPETLTSVPPMGALFAVIYLGAVVTIVAYGLYNYGMSKLPASQATSFINLIPVFAVLMGWSILGERFTTQQILAAVLVLVGVCVSQDFSPGEVKLKIRKSGRTSGSKKQADTRDSTPLP